MLVGVHDATLHALGQESGRLVRVRFPARARRDAEDEWMPEPDALPPVLVLDATYRLVPAPR